MYASYQLISIYILVYQSNNVIMFCSIHVHYLSIINHHPLIHVHLIVHHTCYSCISMFRLCRTVILFIIHFVRDVFNLTHSYRSIEHSKSLNTIPINNYSYKTNNKINPLPTYYYFNIPRMKCLQNTYI